MSNAPKKSRAQVERERLAKVASGKQEPTEKDLQQAFKDLPKSKEPAEPKQSETQQESGQVFDFGIRPDDEQQRQMPQEQADFSAASFGEVSADNNSPEWAQRMIDLLEGLPERIAEALGVNT